MTVTNQASQIGAMRPEDFLVNGKQIQAVGRNMNYSSVRCRNYMFKLFSFAFLQETFKRLVSKNINLLQEV